MKRTESSRAAHNAFLETPIVQNRRPTGPYDFGDKETLRLHLKRPNFNDRPIDDQFGLYLGEHSLEVNSGKKWFCVCVFHTVTCKAEKLEAYESLDELKQEWMLD